MIYIVFLCAAVLLGFPRRVDAYLDPTTGSMVLQIVIGGFLTIAAVVRIYWGKLRRLFRKKDDRTPPARVA